MKPVATRVSKHRQRVSVKLKTDRNRMRCIDALKGMRKLSDESVDSILTSPPYWQLRDYGVEGQVGLEPNLDEYLHKLWAVFDEAKRVLKPSGSCWVNLGDSFGTGRDPGAPARLLKRLRDGRDDPARGYPKCGRVKATRHKCLLAIPEQFMLGMLDRGWILRNKIIWHKPNRTPSSVKDRFTCSWEYLYLFVKSRRYFFDLDAVRVPYKSRGKINLAKKHFRPRPSHCPRPGRLPPHPGEPQGMHPKGKNPDDAVITSPEAHGDFWSISKGCFRGAHFAVFPERLIESPIKAGCPVGGLVLDPFMGAGTTALVARKLGRDYLGFELNPQYVKLAKQRLATEARRRHDRERPPSRRCAR